MMMIDRKDDAARVMRKMNADDPSLCRWRQWHRQRLRDCQRPFRRRVGRRVLGSRRWTPVLVGLLLTLLLLLLVLPHVGAFTYPTTTCTVTVRTASSRRRSSRTTARRRGSVASSASSMSRTSWLRRATSTTASDHDFLHHIRSHDDHPRTKRTFSFSSSSRRAARSGSTRLRASSSSSYKEEEGRPRPQDEISSQIDDDLSSMGSTSDRSKTRTMTQHRTLPMIVQLAVTLLCYGFHTAFLTTNSISFPFQLLPNAKGHFCGITYDSLLGMSILISYLVLVRPQRIRHQLRSQMMKKKAKPVQVDDRSSEDASTTSPAAPPFLREPLPFPWKLPTTSIRWRISSLVALCALVQAYFYAGRFSLFWEDTILNLSGLGFYITAPISRSLQVLMGHLTWVANGSSILRWIPRPPQFFKPGTSAQPHDGIKAGNDDSTTATATDSEPALAPVTQKYRWFRLKIRRSNWLLWTIGGYCVSSFLFNMADGINQYVVPPSLLLDQQETSVVSQLVTPEHNDVVASALAYIAPCITAPWWEEILYRGFLLPLLSSAFGYPIAVLLQAIVFSAHHMSMTAFVPLLVLGYAWGVLYRECQNLWVPILIHALWNSRVFITSWLGI